MLKKSRNDNYIMFQTREGEREREGAHVCVFDESCPPERKRECPYQSY